MMMLQQNKVNSNNDVTTRKNPDSSPGIYLTAAKVAQYRLVAENKRDKEKAKKETAKKTAAQKLCLQQNRSEDFHKCQDSMYSLLLSTYKESMFIKLVNLSLNTLNDAFAHPGCNIGDLPNQRRETVAREIIKRLKLGP